MVVPPEVAQYSRKGGYKIVLQPIDVDSNDAETESTVGADDGARSQAATESVPSDSSTAPRSNDGSETED